MNRDSRRRTSSFARPIMLFPTLVLAGTTLCLSSLASAAPVAPAASGAPVPSGSSPLGTAPQVLNQRLSLEAAVDQALRSNPALQEARQDLAMTEARVTGASAAGQPSLSATLFASHSSWSSILSTPEAARPVNLMGVPPGSFLDQDLMGMLPLYTGGRVAAAANGARRLRDASAADLEAARQDLALQTRIAYRRVLYQLAILDAQQQNLTASQAQLHLDTVRVNAGKLAEVTLFRDRTLAANAQQEVTDAQRDLKQSLFALETVMGVSVQSQLTLTDTLQAPGGSTPAPAASPGAPPGGDLSALLASAEAHRPELRAAQERTAAAAADLRRARAGSNPQVNLVGMGDLTRGGSSGLNYTVGVAAGLPLFEGGALAAAESEAAAALRKAQAAERAVRLQLNNDVAGAIASEDAARQNVLTAQTALAEAQEEYQVQQLRFESGKGIQLEVLDALAALTTARTQLDRAAFEYAVAQDQLLRATGTIPDGDGEGGPGG